MAMIKGVGGHKGSQHISGSSASKPAKPFNEVLTSKQGGAKLDPTIRANQTVKGRLADLLKLGAEPRQVVATALQNNPLYKSLSPTAKEDMLRQITSQMEPLLKG